MTDKIIKALECCNGTMNCSQCPFSTDRNDCAKLEEHALDLIQRQQAEIEHLRDLTKKIKAEAYKEALVKGQTTLQKKLPKVTMDRFEKNIKDVNFTLGQTFEIQCAIEETLKEMTEE